MRYRLLLIGMSHANAVRMALTPSEQASVDFLSFQLIPDLVCAQTGVVNFDLFPQARPDVVALSIGGNSHNVLGMFNHPRPFAIGDPEHGRIPADPARAFIPLDAVHAMFVENMAVLFGHADQIHARYPGVPFVYLSAPPPIKDEAHIRAHPGVFVEKLDLGFSPPALRRALYAAQGHAYARQATRHEATLMPAPTQALTSDGFLDLAFAAKDPTHGNAAYGRLVLEQIETFMEAAA